jgi:hypothetical protein
MPSGATALMHFTSPGGTILASCAHPIHFLRVHSNMRPVITRCLILLTLASSSLAAAESKEWRFTALLDGKPIGYHNFRLVESDAARELTSEARFNVKLLFVSVYRYVHDDRETFQGDCLNRIDARTNDNGKELAVQGRLEAQGFVVSDGQRTATLAPCVLTFAYWNPRILEAKQLLNSQTGRFEPVTVERQAEEPLSVRGRIEPAIKYLLSGEKLKIELWYSRDMQWLGLQSTTDGGRKLRYQLD